MFSHILKYLNGIWLFILMFSCESKNCLNINDPFPEFCRVEWLQSPPQSISQNKGKVILIRWWTDACIFCINSSDALNAWNEKYKEKGLVILGMYHPKPIGYRPNTEEIREFIEEKGFQFPIGLDLDWINLKKDWTDCQPREFTSVSFLLDRSGKILYIHPGGEYHSDLIEGHENCRRDFLQMDSILVAQFP